MKTTKEMTNEEMTKAIAKMMTTLETREGRDGMGWHEASLYETLKACKAHMESVVEFEEFNVPSLYERI
jgi:CRISPR/Cas system CSM-associated protein Csm2 small subunit